MHQTIGPMANPIPRTAQNGAVVVFSQTSPEAHPEETRVWPVYDIEPRFPTWSVDIASQDNGYTLISTLPTGKKQQEVLDSPADPILWLAADMKAELEYVAQRQTSLSGECAWLLLMQRLSDNMPQWLAHTALFVGQDASGGEVQMDGKSVAATLKHYADKYPDKFPGNIWEYFVETHSHHDMGPSPSGTDTRMYHDRGQGFAFQGRYMPYLIVANGGRYNGTLVTYDPVYHVYKDILLGIHYGGQYNAKLTKARKKELDEICDRYIVCRGRGRQGQAMGFGGHVYVGGQSRQEWKCGIGGFSRDDEEDTEFLAHMGFRRGFDGTDRSPEDRFEEAMLGRGGSVRELVPPIAKRREVARGVLSLLSVFLSSDTEDHGDLPIPLVSVATHMYPKIGGYELAKAVGEFLHTAADYASDAGGQEEQLKVVQSVAELACKLVDAIDRNVFPADLDESILLRVRLALLEECDLEEYLQAEEFNRAILGA